MSTEKVRIAEYGCFYKYTTNQNRPSFSARKSQKELSNNSFNELSNYYYPVSISKIQPSISSSDDELEKIREKYAKKFFEFTIESNLNVNPESTYYFGDLINKCNKEILGYAKRNNLDYIEALSISIENLEKAIKDIDSTNKILKKGVKDKSKNELDPSFKSIVAQCRKLTADEKRQAHLNIHFSSALCAGISAFIGEGCTLGADIPLLCCVETNMFYRLSEMLNVPVSASMLHGAKHMF